MKLLALLLPLVAAAPDGRSPSLPEVEVERIEGVDWWTVHARGVTVEHLLAVIARRAGLRVEGLPSPARPLLVNADLEHRPLDQVLEFTLGSVGLDFDLRREAIYVRPGLGPEAKREDRIIAANAAWIRATTRFPGDPAAPSARLAQGELAEMRGLLTAANSHYQTLIDTFPASKAASEALMRSGRIYKRLGRWADASAQFRELASRHEDSEYQAPARLELARCMVELGKPDSARFLLDALEEEYPATDPLVKTERQLVRAEILNALGKYADALRVLDASSRDLDPLAGREVLAVRAVAMEGLQMYADAGRAWLLYARDAGAEERPRALENAARLALAGGDELGVVFIYKEAEHESITPQTVEYWKEARRRLGLADDEGTGESLEDRLLAGEDYLRGEEFEQAAAIFGALYRDVDRLPDELAVRVALGWARCVADSDDVDAALPLLAEVRPRLGTAEARKRLDLGAARLLEDDDRFAEAVEAYRGIYGGTR